MTDTTETARAAERLRGIRICMGLPWPAEYRQHVFDSLGESADLLDEAAAALREMMTATGPICGLDPAEVIDARERARAVLARLNGETPR
jgi:hypothetical protein